jgi:excisionase family DNA binding protein
LEARKGKMATSAQAAVSRADEHDQTEPELISVHDACRFLGVHRNTLYKLIREGELPAFRLVKGGRWRFRRSDLQQWLEDCQARGSR